MSLNPRDILIPFIDKLTNKYEIVWVNRERNSSDWKVRIYQHQPSGRYLAVYDRKYSLIRIQSDLPEIDGVKRLPTCPKSSAFNNSYPCFSEGKGFCFEVENVVALEKVLSVYLNLSFAKNALGEYESELEEKVKRSLILGKTARAERLKNAPKLPKKYNIEVSVFERNPDVIAEVLERASGKCELCRNLAPFNRKKDGSPYLEVHHKVQLSFGGEDTVDNAIAICPNCHRKEHHG